MDLDVFLSGFVPTPAEAGDANAIVKAVASVIGDVNPSHPSASHAVTAPPPLHTGSDDDRPLAVGHDLDSSGFLRRSPVVPPAGTG